MYTLYIKKYRKLRRITQTELAERIGVTQQCVALLESDNIIRKRSPKLSIILDVSFALEVCPNLILHYVCSDCKLYKNCNKRESLENEDNDFYEENLQYYI